MAPSSPRPSRAPSRRSKLSRAWVVSFHVTWILGALGIWYLFVSTETVEQLAREECYKQVDYAQLAAMPAENVLVISNLGAPVLRYTPHRVLAGPYHRNLDGNIAALDAFIGTPAKAEEIARANSIGLVAFCGGNPETAFLAERARGPAGNAACGGSSRLAGDCHCEQNWGARIVPYRPQD